MQALSIGALANRTGVKIPTIRYYEQIGLLAEPDRSEGGQRRYDSSALERLSFIRHARDLGLPVDAIRDLVRLAGEPGRPCEAADRIAQDHLLAVREKIKRLKKLEKELERIATQCDGHDIGECYVIQALSDHGLCDHDH